MTTVLQAIFAGDRAMLGRLVLFGSLLVCGIASAETELPAPPSINSLHYKRISVSAKRAPQRTMQWTVDCDSNNERVQTLFEDATEPPSTAELISLWTFDPVRGVTTRYDLNAQTKTGTRRSYPGRVESGAISFFQQEFYPSYWQRILDGKGSGHKGQRVQRIQDETLNGAPASVYQWDDALMDAHYRWWLMLRDGMWVPVQYANDDRFKPTQISEVVINRAIPGEVFAVPTDYVITDVATDTSPSTQ